MAQEDPTTANATEAAPVAFKADEGFANGTASNPSRQLSEKEATQQNGAEESSDSTKADAKPDLPTGSVCEIKSLVSRIKDGDTIVTEKDDYLSSWEKKPFVRYALVAKQIFNDKDKLEKTTVEVNSPELLKALREVVKHYPSEPLQFEQQPKFDNPFMLLNHYKQELKQYAEESTDETTKTHIDLLLHFITTEAGDKGPESQRLIRAGLISFDLLWIVFKPGDLLYSSTYGHDRLYRLQKTGYQDSNSSRGKFFELSCAYTSFDGIRAGTSSVNLRIWEKKEFVGSCPSRITDLSVFPSKYSEGRESLEKRLIERGKWYLQIRSVETFDYNGLFLYLKTPPYDFYNESADYNGTWLPRSAIGRVIVDAKTFIEEMRDQKEEVSDPADACKGAWLSHQLIL